MLPDQTALEALHAGGIDIPMSCEQGVCGTCLTPVLRGEPEHRDQYLTPEEQAANDQMLLCCSRARSAIAGPPPRHGARPGGRRCWCGCSVCWREKASNCFRLSGLVR